jgi:benzoyl-CoA reductase/2-hydroxyglutaryl-CoA dehydratase subunit BcrC/BadD/HgdB
MLLRKRVPSFGLIENLVEALSEQYLYNVPGPCRNNPSRRINYILKTVRDFRVHGLIYYKGKNPCISLGNQVKPIKDRVYKELLVPTFIVDNVTAEAEGSLRERLSSFIDIVGGRV